MRKTLVLAAVTTAMLCVTTAARADDFDPWFAASRAGGFIDLWPTQDRTAVMFGAELQLRVARSVFIDVSISGAAAQHDAYTGDEIRLAYGNPTVGAHYAGTPTRNFAFFVGGTLTVPFLHDPDTDVATAATLTAPIRGLYDADRFFVGYMAVRAMAGLEWNIVTPLYFRAELRPVVYIPTRNTTIAGFDVDREADLAIEHAIEIEGRLRNGFGFGARLQAVGLPTVNGDQAQVVFEPFIALTPKRRGFYMKLGAPIALDSPYGWGLDRDKLAAGRIALGGQW
jgi:hypothetical protein